VWRGGWVSLCVCERERENAKLTKKARADKLFKLLQRVFLLLFSPTCTMTSTT